LKVASVTIVRRDSGRIVRVRGDNGKKLSSTEILESRASAIGNVLAQSEVWRLWLAGQIRTQFRDERTKKSKRRRRSAKS
jgi:hypothetical protein